MEQSNTSYIKFMRAAIGEARKAESRGEVPVGAVIVKEGKIIARGHNTRITAADASAHAEIIAIRKAGKKLGSWHLDGCTMYVTLEPCAMCAGALINSRIDRVVFGAFDMRFGCCGSLLSLPDDQRFNHRVIIESGVLRDECAALLTNFFKSRR